MWSTTRVPPVSHYSLLYRGEELTRNVQALVLCATSLDIYADRLAVRLPGGNQRKLALAIALIGNSCSMSSPRVSTLEMEVVFAAAVGTTDALAQRYATYEVHFCCPTCDEVVRAQELMTQIPGACMADASRRASKCRSGRTCPLRDSSGYSHRKRTSRGVHRTKSGTGEHVLVSSPFFVERRSSERTMCYEDRSTPKRRWQRTC
ncbi:uncharacterized protein C8Q71DRAFT_30701 [Rhodofomes roseus]|uniref:Uncharacterized protein n=1 Tax=Rhodofomes roseus TaxID=34475 RepID=A0ABQ8L062_9APHY|nr:uncharacterized protein C8Q71DRAFT_30701 [Rhodofomes roseus]KAH9844115.1 hypothetical protein C8Q71DRAFT_30701 [Rhodofomes roseus]